MQIQPPMSAEDNEQRRIQILKDQLQLAKSIIQEIRATPAVSKKRTLKDFIRDYPDAGLSNDKGFTSKKFKVDLYGDHPDRTLIRPQHTLDNSPITIHSGGSATDPSTLYQSSHLRPDSHQD